MFCFTFLGVCFARWCERMRKHAHDKKPAKVVIFFEINKNYPRFQLKKSFFRNLFCTSHKNVLPLQSLFNYVGYTYHIRRIYVT